jgi:hypothetical protein
MTGIVYEKIPSPLCGLVKFFWVIESPFAILILYGLHLNIDIKAFYYFLREDFVFI